MTPSVDLLSQKGNQQDIPRAKSTLQPTQSPKAVKAASKVPKIIQHLTQRHQHQRNTSVPRQMVNKFDRKLSSYADRGKYIPNMFEAEHDSRNGAINTKISANSNFCSSIDYDVNLFKNNLTNFKNSPGPSQSSNYSPAPIIRTPQNNADTDTVT